MKTLAKTLNISAGPGKSKPYTLFLLYIYNVSFCCRGVLMSMMKKYIILFPSILYSVVGRWPKRDRNERVIQRLFCQDSYKLFVKNRILLDFVLVFRGRCSGKKKFCKCIRKVFENFSKSY